MWHKRMGALALVLIGSLALAACAPSATAPTGEKAAPGTEKATPGAPKQGGILVRSAGSQSFAGTDPGMGQMSYQVWPYIALMILKTEPDTFNIVGDGVESWKWSDNGLELTLNVRKGVKFPNVPPTNGREVEAKDVVYSLKTITGQLYPELPSVRFPRKSNLDEMVDAVAVDKYTVKVTLSKPSSTFLSGLSEYRSAMILPDGLRESFGDIQSLAAPSVEKYISAGPFVMTKFVQQTEAKYQRNPDFWKKGQPYLDGLHEIWIPDRSTEMAAFIAQKVDYISLQENEEREFVTRSRKDAVITNYPPPSCWYRVAFNLTKKPFDDVRVRKAIALVINHEELGKNITGEWQGKPLWKYPGSLPWVFPESLSQEELKAMKLYQGPTPEKIAEAKKLLADAGLSGGLEMEMISSKSVRSTAGMTIVQAQVEKALPGVKIKQAPLDNAINLNRAQQGDFQTQHYCYIHDATGLSMMKTAYHSTGGRNLARYNNPKMDELLDKASSELDDQKRKELLRQAQLLALEDLPYIPTFHYEAQNATQPWVKGMRLGAASSEKTWFEDVWFDGAPPKR
ncbi:MAG: peptide transporter substrate-binding protein [Dehalococcoidia bacterium]|nr:peptide transporter substrate-binding protein [Dehalococcoidia bacterium]